MNFLLPSPVLAWPHLATAGRAEGWSHPDVAVARPLLVTAAGLHFSTLSLLFL